MVTVVLTENELRIYTIAQVMQLLADSSDDSGSDLNLSDLGVGGNSSASDMEGSDIPAPAEADPALLSTSTGLSLGPGGCRLMGASATARPTGKCRKQASISGDAVLNVKYMTSEVAKVSIFCHFQKKFIL